MKGKYVADISRYVQRHIVTWADVHRDSKILVRTLLNLGQWTGIVALTRGGLVPAAIVAREMDIRVADTLCVSTYDEQKRGAVNIFKIQTTASKINGMGWLLIDDLVDTGTTAHTAREILPKSHFATLYAKPKGRPQVHTHVRDAGPGHLGVFPMGHGTTICPTAG